MLKDFESFGNAAISCFPHITQVPSGVTHAGGFIFARQGKHLCILQDEWQLTRRLLDVGDEVLIAGLFATDVNLADMAKLCIRGKIAERSFVVDAVAGTQHARSKYRASTILKKAHVRISPGVTLHERTPKTESVS